MPQGGIDEGEEPWATALRELEEETGIPPHLVERIAECPERLNYDLPDELRGKLWGGKWKGQDQDWYLARFLGDDSDVEHRHRTSRVPRMEVDRARSTSPTDRAVQARPLPAAAGGFADYPDAAARGGVRSTRLTARSRRHGGTVVDSRDATSSNARAAEPMLDQVLAWAAVNSGSRNLARARAHGGPAGRRLRGASRSASARKPGEGRSGRSSGRTVADPARPPSAPDGAADGAAAAAAHRPHGHGVRPRPRVPGDALARGRGAERPRRRRHEGRDRGDAGGA